jgi:hypothetical protein
MLSVTATVTDAGGHTGSATASAMVAGVDTAALLAGITSTVTTNVTHSTPGQTFNHVDFSCRVSNTTSDTTYNDCVFRGDNSVNALFSCTNINAKRIKFNRCWWIPTFDRVEHNAIQGHDFELYDFLIENTVDGLSIQNSGQFAATGAGWATGVIGRRGVIRRLARLTSTSKTLAGANDTVTHNDGVQQFGGVGTDLEDVIIDARPGRQVGHLYLQSPAGHVYTVAEAWSLPDAGPFLSVPAGTLPDGGPFASPFLDATHPARPLPWVSNGSGLASAGELSSTDWSAIMCNNSQGYSAGFRLVNVHFYGGEFTINSGGNPYPGSGISWGTMTDCRFDRSQGQTGRAIELQGGWSGHCTIPTSGPGANTYFDGGTITAHL